MTKEEMLEVRDKVIAALRASGDFEGIEGIDFEDGAPLPIAFFLDGDPFVLELDVG